MHKLTSNSSRCVIASMEIFATIVLDALLNHLRIRFSIDADTVKKWLKPYIYIFTSPMHGYSNHSGDF